VGLRRAFPGPVRIARFHPQAGQDGSFAIGTIEFEPNLIESHDLHQYYSSLLGGQSVTNIELIAGSLPSGVTINVGNESLDHDGTGTEGSVSGLQIRVTTT